MATELERKNHKRNKNTIAEPAAPDRIYQEEMDLDNEKTSFVAGKFSVKGKKYDKEQILQMLTIYTLKSTLSINEIKRLLQGMYATEGFDEAELTRLYDRYIEIKDNNREYALSTVDGIIDRNSLDISNDLDYISLICSITAFSAHLKNIAQAMIDNRFPNQLTDVDVEEPTDKREMRIERKKEKITAKSEAKVAKVEAKVAKVEAKTEVKMARVSSKSKSKTI